MTLTKRVALAALLIGAAPIALSAQIVAPTTPPAAPDFPAQGEPVFVDRAEILNFRALDSYNEPEFVSAFVEAGLLPPVAERLPVAPLVYETANMPDGVGVYGDVMRHVIGGRPEGWNYWAGQSQGWGGIDIGLSECLTRTGPLFMVNATDLQPLPNLAQSWEWSEDGLSLTVNLIEGAKWSDGDAFDTEDIDFYWNHILMDPEVSPLNGANPATYGVGTTMEVTGPYQFKLTFQTAFPEDVLYAFAYGNFCPGPSHVLKPVHPAFSDNDYLQFRNAFPPEYMNFPTMGAWAVVEHRSDDIVVMRRNPYYWKVDSDGNQLPYLNEMHYRLSTWADRDVQAVAGTGDFSNLEQAENFVEALQRAAQPDAPARLAFGPRTIGYSMIPNLSGNGWGEPDARAQAIRDLNRNLDFRQGVTQALDRARLGDSLVRGPFTVQHPGGLFAGTSYYDEASTVFYPYSLESAQAHFAAAGLVDTDGNGILNHPADVLGGADVQITLLANADYQTERNLAEGVVAMLEEAGIKVALNIQTGTNRDAARDNGQYDWMVERAVSSIISVVQNTSQLAPIGAQSYVGHRANDAGELDLLPFEEELVGLVSSFIASRDADERQQIMRDYQHTYTENVFQVGLTAYPGALVINKRFANVPPGTPIMIYNWAEDSVIRERLYVPADAQQDLELFPETLPGAPGSAGAISAG